MSTHDLVARDGPPGRRGTGVLARTSGDFGYLQDVVRIGFPVRDARSYLNRHLGNPVAFRLVEVRRGEQLAKVREIEVQPASGGETVHVRAVRTLPDGSPASYFTPGDIVDVNAVIETGSGAEIPPLRPRDQIILHIPVRSYMRFLPGLFQGAVPTQSRELVPVTERSARQWGARDEVEVTTVQVHHADQFRRFLFLFQHLMTGVIDKIDAIPSLTDPMVADPKFLPWIASWVSFELDGSLPLHQQRELVRRSIRLHRTRGTRVGVEEMIKVLTSAPVQVAERSKPQPLVLGAMTLAGGRNVVERYHRGEPPAHYIVEPDRAATSFFKLVLEDRGAFRERFGERAPAVLRRISQIVTNERPAHVTFTIEFDERV